jgi:hypothetical protein
MGSTSRGTWKQFERVIAAAWDKVFGSADEVIKRNILSGANNRRDDGSSRPGDVALPKWLDVLVEAKYRSSFLHHALYRNAVADAAKHKLTHTILYTRQKHEVGYLAVLSADLFHDLLALPGAKELLSRK